MLGRAAITDGKGNFSIENIEVSQPQKDEVLVKMMAAGICHTDYDSLNWNTPLVMGHEGAGIVEAVGNEVTTVKVGDKVVLNWAIPCGKCFQCQEMNQNICENNSPVTVGNQTSGGAISQGHARLESTLYKGKGIQRSFNLGTISTHAMVKENAVVKFDTPISFASAAIIGCGVMTGYGSVVNTAQVKAGSSVAVLGTGGVGLSVIQGARISGAEKIIAIDINPLRLEMAKRFGATHTIVADKNDTNLLHAAEEVKEMTDGRGADYAFECTAIPELGAAPLAMIRNAGTAVQVSGIEDKISIDMNLFQWDKIYINPLYGRCRPQIDYPILLNLYKKGDLMLDEMVTRKYKFEDLPKAFEDMLAGRNAKGVIIFDQ
ncbi:Zn-dependent alcohol dehydrogenase [Seonamhaeicola aphaedonensis]|uniref:S-(Hydroxymethyl)glutathione dehydrogenase/alcohol dehydrogenase n=1 Tax=Seonamhaeicola aphaedonensis TaxID=1461338 RepID=A0A3D9HDF7_9FLAO|nr:Zn-dependent alcohol dehydrogenase [Seonamhaeicola aphaedonensis]RED47493.1 S-(hydroxymethyl)glutathione dehydrogenase/alcohol dehydrogenase [Seonamhaeicola aphaedonensis]